MTDDPLEEEINHRCKGARKQLGILHETLADADHELAPEAAAIEEEIRYLWERLVDEPETQDRNHEVGPLPDGGRVVGATGPAAVPHSTCDGCGEARAGEPRFVVDDTAEQYCSKRCLIQDHAFLRGALHCCEECGRVFDDLEVLAGHYCGTPAGAIAEVSEA